jgi:hypothetical protein
MPSSAQQFGTPSSSSRSHPAVHRAAIAATAVRHRAQPRRRMEPTPRVATVCEVDAVKQGEVPGKLMKLLGMTPV